MIRVSGFGKCHECAEYLFLQFIAYAGDATDFHSVGIVEEEWYIRTVPCDFAVHKRKLQRKIIQISTGVSFFRREEPQAAWKADALPGQQTGGLWDIYPGRLLQMPVSFPQYVPHKLF